MLHFWNLHESFKIFLKKMSLIDDVFAKLGTGKNVATYISIKPVSEHPWIVNILKGPKRCWNLPDSTLITLFYHSEKICVGKSFS